MSWIYVGAATGLGVTMGAGLELMREWLGMKWQNGTAVEGGLALTLSGCPEQQHQQWEQRHREQQEQQEQPQQHEQQQQQQQQAGPCFATLPNNILQDIASRLDGWSLLALLCTCHGLHDSHALRAGLFGAVQHQITSLHTALQTSLQGLDEADSLLQLIQSIRDAISEPSFIARLPSLKMLQYELRNNDREPKRAAMVDLLKAKETLESVNVMGAPSEQLKSYDGPVDPSGRLATPEYYALLLDDILGVMVGAAKKAATDALQLGPSPRQSGPSEQRLLLLHLETMQAQPAWPGQEDEMQDMQRMVDAVTRGLQAGQQLRRAQQLQQQVTAVQRAYQLGPAGQQQQQLTQPQLHQMRDALQLTDDYLEVNERLQRKLQEAIDALQAGPAEQQTSDEVFRELGLIQGGVQDGQRDMLQWALYALARGEPQAGAALQLVQQLRAEDLKRVARAILQQTVQVGEEASQTWHVGVVRLREAVQKGQEALQG